MLRHLLFWPVTGPNFLVRFSLGKVQETLRQELTDDEVVKEELLALQMRLELGEIEDDQYVEEEARLMERLREVRRWKEEFGMATSGGAVRVARDPGPDPEPEEEREPRSVEEGPRRGGIASAEGATVELNLDDQ